MTAEQGISSGGQLFDGILAGQVPRQVRLFAAQGLLPVAREDLFRLQLVLTADPDRELAAAAAASIAEVDTEVLIRWVREVDVDGLTLDLLIRVRKEPAIWLAVARHKNVSDESLRVLAAHGDGSVQDVIITNQVRLLDCLEILEDLRSNTQITPVVLRRVREFEEEFIAKAAAMAEPTAGQEAAEGQETHTIEEALAALRAIGAHLPGEEDLQASDDRDPGIEEAVRKVQVSALGKILNMSVKEKIMCAMRGSREERAILVNSRNRLVMRAVLASPKLKDAEIERFAASRSVSDEVIRAIASNNRWLRHYPVVLAVLQNPKAPIQQSLRLLSRLSFKDIHRLSMDRNINPIIRRQARNRVDQMRR